MWFTQFRMLSFVIWAKIAVCSDFLQTSLGWSENFLASSSSGIRGPPVDLLMLCIEAVLEDVLEVTKTKVVSSCRLLTASKLCFLHFFSHSDGFITNSKRVLNRPPCLRLGLKRVLWVTTFYKVVPSTLWALTYNQVTIFCNLLSLNSSETLNHFRVKSKHGGCARCYLSIYVQTNHLVY